LKQSLELKNKTLKLNFKIELGIKRECFRIKTLKQGKWDKSFKQKLEPLYNQTTSWKLSP
jgi:hypothetical protein